MPISEESRPSCCGNVGKEEEFPGRNETQYPGVEFGRGSRGLAVCGGPSGWEPGSSDIYTYRYVYIHTQVSLYLLTLWYLLLCECGDVPITVYAWRSEGSFQESVLSFQHGSQGLDSGQQPLPAKPSLHP